MGPSTHIVVDAENYEPNTLHADVLAVVLRISKMEVSTKPFGK